jgi:hypothetical protein
MSNITALRNDERRQHRAVLEAWRIAILSGDETTIDQAFVAVAHRYLLRRAFLVAARLPEIPADTRQHMAWRWCKDGDSIRDQVNSDLVLIAGLRALLPHYTGPGLMLWRGDSWFNRRRRTYGMSWTSKRDVAERFAAGPYRTFTGGSVILEASVPAAAIICDLDRHLSANMRGEREFLIDRRRLGRVHVVERFGQISHEDYRLTIEQS